MPQKSHEEMTSVSVPMRGDLARVFDELFAEAYLAREVRSRAEFARSLIVEQLRAMGHDVEDEISNWGGSRLPSTEDDSQGQLVGSTKAYA